MTLTEFLLARIADDEAVVRLHDNWGPRGGYELYDQFGDFGDDERWMIEIPFNRLLAECESKRRIVELHQADHEHPCGRVEWTGFVANEYVAEDYGCKTVAILALPYADHPDYRQEWRP